MNEIKAQADAKGADIVVMEGLSSVKLATHISTLLQQYSETKTDEFTE